MGWLQDTVGGALDLMHDVDPLGSALLNGVIDVDTAMVGNTMGTFSDAGAAIGDDNLQSFGHHWEDMARRDHANHARAVTNAGLTLAALYGGYYAAGPGAGTAAGAGAGGASSSMALNAATGGDQDSIAKAGLIGGASGYAGNYAQGAYGNMGTGGEVSGMDLAADAGAGSGNNIYSAGSGTAVSSASKPTLGARMVGGATAGATSAALSGGNIGKSAITGALGAGTPDVGSQLGIEDPNLRNAFNGATKSAIGAGLQGGNIGAGAISGAVPGLIGYGAQSMGDNYLNGPIPGDVGLALSPSGNYVDTAGNDLGFSGYTPSLEGNSNPIKDQLKSYLGYGQDLYNKIGGARGLGDIVQGLAGIYAGNKQRMQVRNIMGMMGANRSAYEAQLRKELMAKDAAAGRRSDYGGRATQLQAALAQLDSRNAPGLADLSRMQTMGNYQMLNSGLSMLGNLGAFGSSYQRPNVSPRPVAPMQMPSYTPINMPDLYQQRNTLAE